MQRSSDVVTDGAFRRPAVLVAAVTLSLSVGVLAGCGPAESPEPGSGASEGSPVPGQGGASTAPTPSAPTSAGQPTLAYAGAYDAAFRADLAAYSGQRVTLSGTVGDLDDSRAAYELVDPADPGLERLLISAQDPVPDLEIGDLVEVTGTVQDEFRPSAGADAEDGQEPTGVYARHLEEPYLDQARTEITDSPGA